VTFLRFLTTVLRFVPTPAQSVLVRVYFDDEDPATFTYEDQALAVLLFGELDDVPDVAREVLVLVKGARIGGTYLCACYLLFRALMADLSGLAPGEHASALIVGPDMRLGRQALRYARGAVASVPALEEMVIADGSDAFTLEREDGQRVAIETLPATRGGSALRGRSLVAAQFTESCFFRDADSGVVNDAECFRGVRPRVMPGGKTVLESTPWIEAGITFELFRDNFGDPKTAIAARAPTTLMRPDAAMRARVQAEEARDAENAAREFGAEFVGGGAAMLFDAHSTKLAVDESRPLVSLARAEAVQGWGGDLALVSDSSVLAGVDRVGDHYALLEIEEHRPAKGEPLKLSEVIASFAIVLARHGATSFTADGHVREPAREWTDLAGIQVEDAPNGNAGKWETYAFFATLLREGRFTMARHPRLEAQLRAVVSKPMQGGGYRITSPRRPGGGHGDIVSAVVLAVWAASQMGGSHEPPTVVYGDGFRWGSTDRGF
jgi:catechol 2,3-dioxygenase-like lactoylglutathione lyase family enzyme